MGSGCYHGMAAFDDFETFTKRRRLSEPAEFLVSSSLM
jgi:hypothetical protein